MGTQVEDGRLLRLASMLALYQAKIFEGGGVWRSLQL